MGCFLECCSCSAAVAMPLIKAETTTTVISSSTSFTGTINAGDTLIIQNGVILTSDGITNNRNIVNSGAIRLNGGKALGNYGIILNIGGGRAESGIVNNYFSGIIKNDVGDNDVAPGNGLVNNYGTFVSYNGIRGSYTTINNYKTGLIGSHNLGYLYNSNLNNYGGLINGYGAITLDCCTIFNNGTINTYAGIGVRNSQSADVIQNSAGGVFNNFAGSLISIPSRPGGYTKELANSGTLNNDGKISSSGLLANPGFSTTMAQ